MSDQLTGGCQCGAVRYTIASASLAYCCHCTECQKQSASAYGISVPVFQNNFSVDGELHCWTRATESGSLTDCYFCAKCGSRVYHSGQSRHGMITVKGGSLDEPSRLPVVAHIWTKSARKDVFVDPAVKQWDKQPTNNSEWLELFKLSKAV